MSKNFSDFGVKTSNVRLNTANAWALYARRRWPENGIKMAMREWGLTEGRAKGLFSGAVTQQTIDLILDHKRGGFMLGLLVFQIRMQTSVGDALETERARLDAEYQQAVAVNRRAAALAGDLGSFRRLAGERPVRVAGQSDGGLGCGDD